LGATARKSPIGVG